MLRSVFACIVLVFCCYFRFDVEKECSKIDEDYKEKTVINNKAHLSKIETKIDTAGNKRKGGLVLFQPFNYRKHVSRGHIVLEHY